MSMLLHNASSRQRGIATIEFAICAPVLLLLMLATAEVGRMLIQYNTLNKAVRDGARYAVREAAAGSTGTVAITTEVRDNTRNLVVTGTMAGTGAPLLPGLTVDNVAVTDAGAGFVAVSATYTYQPILGAALPTFGSRGAISTNVPLTATVVMRALL
jgi:Flp pilus assembly protein TadG